MAAALREVDTTAAIAPDGGRNVADLYAVEQGPADGQAVLLFHGTAGWSALWAPTQSALAGAGFRSIAYDIPPFGFSTRPADGKYDRTAQAARVIALLDEMAIDRVILVGHSYGAGPAVETAMRYPDRVAGLVLVDAALGLTQAADTQKPPFFLRSRLIRETLVATTATNPLLTRRLLASLLARKEAATAEMAELLQRPMTIENSTVDMGDWLAAFMSHDEAALSSKRDAYRTLDLPSAILWGSADTVTPPAQGEDLAELIPGAELQILPGVGHIPYLEDPELFIPALVRTIDGLASPN